MSTKLRKELDVAFEELKKTEAEKIYSAIENREFIPTPFALPVVWETVKKVLVNHKVSREEFELSLGLRMGDLSVEEIAAINQLFDEE